MESIKGYVEDSGEGRWTVEAAISKSVPAHVITSSLYSRFESRQKDSFAMKMLAALRNQFGGHKVVKDEINNTTAPRIYDDNVKADTVKAEKVKKDIGK